MSVTAIYRHLLRKMVYSVAAREIKSEFWLLLETRQGVINRREVEIRIQSFCFFEVNGNPDNKC
jgi:hypothetical protein